MTEEEITIDFGKIKDFFKKKEEPKEKGKERGEDEISIDFGKIKNLFKKKETEPKKEGEELGIDVASIGGFLKKHRVFLLLLIPIILSIFLRMQAAELGFTDGWAINSVHTYYQNSIRAQINQQYPNLPEARKQELVSQQFTQFLKDNKQQVDDQIMQTSNYFKAAFQDDKGRMYMPDIDPYYWYRYAKNIVDHGYAGDIKKNGLDWDTYQVAPNGRPVGKQDTFHPYFLATLYKIISPFTGVDLMRAIMYYPVIISALSIIPIFFIARRIAGNTAAIFAGIMAAANMAFLNRTLFGHADSDAWVLLFPVFTAWLFLEAFESENMKKQIILSIASGFFVGLFSFVWGGWWYIFDFILATVGIYVVYYLVIHYKQLIKGELLNIIKSPAIKDIIIVSIAFIISSGIFVSMFSNPQNFFTTPLSSIGFTSIKAPVSTSLWPNVLTTVAELNPGTIDQIVAQMGGKILFYLGVIGIVLSILRKDRHGRLDLKPAILLAIWFVSTMYASTKGIRFTLLLVPAFSIAFGVAIGKIHLYATRWTAKELKVNKLIVSTILILLLSMTVWAVPISGGGNCQWYLGSLPVFGSSRGLLCAAYQTARQDIPIINDAWYSALIKIRDDTPKDTIITSWWDFGHHFKALAERRVTFDGTTQDYPQAHWVGKLFMTDDDDLAMGILRMLDCGGEYTTDVLTRINGGDTRQAVKIVYDIIKLSRTDAKQKLLEYGLTSEQADEVLQYSHCEPPNAVVIASEDMIGKSGVWGHFGSWSFERAEIWAKTRDMKKEEAVNYMQAKLNYTKERAEQTYYEVQAITSDSEANNWVAPWPSYGGVSSCSVTDDLVSCGDGVKINLTTMDAWFEAGEQKLHPYSIVYATPTEVVEKKFGENVIPQGLSVILVPVDNGYNSVIAQPPVANGIFTKLFFFEGHGLEHFKLLTYERGITGTGVYVWKVDWEGGEKNIMSKLKPKEIVENGNTVTVNYIGYLEDGSIFDASIKNWGTFNITKETNFEEGFEYTPLKFKVGSGQVITGFDEAVLGMKINQTKTVKLPPEKAYGTDVSVPLGNKTLNFKIKLIKIE